MKRIVIVFILAALAFSCGSKKQIITKKRTTKPPTKVVIKRETPTRTTAPKPITTVVLSDTEAYIAQYKEVAKKEMTLYKIPASITLAQGILESASGKGRLSVKANNHFGIKCHNWSGGRIYHDDDKKGECFRKYNNAKYSFRDHSVFLSGRKRYASLFDLRPDDYKGWAIGLRAAGYATDRRYPQKLISLIERYQLYNYDAAVLGKPTSSRVPQQPNSTQNGIVHVVKKGDTLYALSKYYQTTVKNIQKLNNIDGTALALGQILKIK